MDGLYEEKFEVSVAELSRLVTREVQEDIDKIVDEVCDKEATPDREELLGKTVQELIKLDEVPDDVRERLKGYSQAVLHEVS